MDGREGMSLQGPSSYYLNRGDIGGSSGSGSVSNFNGGGGGVNRPTPFKSLYDPNITLHPHVGIGGGAVGGSAFDVDNPSPSCPPGMSTTVMSSASRGSEIVKKKRGRPRKYGLEGGKISLGLSPSSASEHSSELATPGEKPRKGRPPGSGWKQKLAPLGEWMNNSAGLAFTPHVLHIADGEDVAAKILAFAQQKPRALCILSGSGSVSAVTLRQPTNSCDTMTYEGRFEILLCLSGSYLLSEIGGPRNRTGGINISVCSPDGHMIGGAIGGRLIAADHVQVVACSFVYGSTKANNKAETETTDEKYLLPQSAEDLPTPVSAAANQNLTPNSGATVWPPGSRPDFRNSDAKIDLTRGCYTYD